jgi:hypothetical protein
MGLFTKKILPKPDNMISTGIILEPSVLTSSSQEQFTPAKKGPSTKVTPNQSVTPDNAPTSIPSRNINFVENYTNWCVSPVLNNIYKQEIKLPIIHFKEFRLLTSTLWEQLKYFTFLAATVPGRLAGDVERFFQGDSGEGSPLPEYIVEGLKQTQEEIDKGFSAVNGALEALKIDTPDMARASSDDPYEGLYSPEETGFKYTFPYYTSLLKEKRSSYSDTYNANGMGALPTFLDSTINNYTAKRDPGKGVRALVEPGLFIEKTKFYNFGDNESISFSFPLLNTISREQINENYQFLFLLIYQNTMYRKDRSAFIPPCIYEVLVPGTRYMKWAYISRLSVDFIGTRRMIEVDSGIGVFKTIVPEAYNVNISVTSLHEEAGNFLIRAAAGDFSDIKIRDIIESPMRPLDLATRQTDPRQTRTDLRRQERGPDRSQPRQGRVPPPR